MVHLFHPKVGSAIQAKVTTNLRGNNKRSPKQSPTDTNSTKGLTNKAQDEIEQAKRLAIKKPEYASVNQFIKDMHRGEGGFNNVVCYGKINSLNWSDVDRLAVSTIFYVHYFEPSLKGTVKEDLEHASSVAENVIKDEYATKRTDNVVLLHRIFHDLDIAVNHYKGYDRIWGVNKTPT